MKNITKNSFFGQRLLSLKGKCEVRTISLLLCTAISLFFSSSALGITSRYIRAATTPVGVSGVTSYCYGANSTGFTCTHTISSCTAIATSISPVISYQWLLDGANLTGTGTSGSYAAASSNGTVTTTLPAAIANTFAVGTHSLQCRFSYNTSPPCGSPLSNPYVTGSRTVIVNGTTAVTTGGSGTFCGSTTITASGGTGGTIYFQGTNAAGTSTATPATSAVVTSTGTYYFRALSTAGSCWGTPASVSVTINSLPAALTGPTSVCQTSSISLSHAITGGTWLSSSASIASVTGGTVTGVLAGNAGITYTLPGFAVSSGCYTVKTISVNASPAAITGTLSVCSGLTRVLGMTSTGGTWSSDAAGVATVAGGTVTGVSGGVSNIAYTFSNGCQKSVTFSVNPTPVVSVTPTSPTICLNETVNASASSPDGTFAVLSQNFNQGLGAWTLTNGTGSAASYFQLATPPGAYSVAGDGSQMLQSAPIAFGGVTNTTLTSPSFSTQGAMTPFTLTFNQYIVSSGATVAAVEYSVNGGAWTTLVSQVIPGSGIGTGTWSASAPEFTMALPAAAVNKADVRLRWVYSSSLVYWFLDNIAVKGKLAPSGYAWSGAAGLSCSTCASPDLTPTSAGSKIYSVTVTNSTGCAASAGIAVSVNPLPANIGGTLSVCENSETTLTNTSTGGTWVSGDLATGTIDASSGVLTGLAAGTSVITYTLPTTCKITAEATVLAAPAAITGTANVCVESTTTLSNATGGGTWSSANPAIATIDASGVVTGITDGLTNISYMLSSGCVMTREVTVNPLPNAITGSQEVCENATVTFASTSTGGAWASSNATAATVDAGGIITGLVQGDAVITYTLPTGCLATRALSVNLTPQMIGGVLEACENATSLLSDATLGGTWSSSNTTAATIDATGDVSALTAGLSNISYTLSTGCYASAEFTVNGLPTAITGSQEVCEGAVVTYASTPATGTWESSNVAAATIDGSGVITGIAQGTADITYTLPTGCIAIRDITVNPLPANIIGASAVCQGESTTMSDPTNDGTWSSSSAVAAIDAASGLVTTTTASFGTATISYVLNATGCAALHEFTVNELPTTISGPTEVCVDGHTTLSNTPLGGTWESNDPATLVIDATTGVTTGINQGTALVSYSMPTGCRSTTVITVNPLPEHIIGAHVVCAGLVTTLTNATPLGTWSSADISIATVSATGDVAGQSAGTTDIVYTLGTGCKDVFTFTTNPLPAAITGNQEVCEESTTTLDNTDLGGNWTSGNTAVASFATGGTLLGITDGNATVTYMLPTGCIITAEVTVDPLPNAITGVAEVCEGLQTNLASTTSGGDWTSLDGSVATVSSAGVVLGGDAGITDIVYTIPLTGCAVSRTVTVNTTPDPITGQAEACPGLASTLFSSPSGGTWSSANTGTATVNATGDVTAIAAGATNIIYTLPEGCSAVSEFTVNPLPADISGMLSVCKDASTTLGNTSAGGVWESGSLAVGTIDATSGVVSGLSQGTTVITYTLPTTCLITAVVTVNPLPNPITGIQNVCLGLTTAFSNSTSGGVWSSASNSIAMVNSSGVVSGAGVGSTHITYTLPTTCYAVASVVVNSLPADISGASTICAGSTTVYTDATINGTWGSDNDAVGIIDATGLLSAVSSGSVNISYTLPTGCLKTTSVWVNVLPAPIAGNLVVCHGSTTLLTNTTAGGDWTSTNPGVALVDPAGLVRGQSVGSSEIAYTIPATGCKRTVNFNVNALPDPIIGTSELCAGQYTSFTSATTGGTWRASNMAVLVNSAGLVSAVAAGTSTVSYTMGNGCGRTMQVTVNTLPGLINGTGALCPGATTTLSNVRAGGTWSSNDNAIAMIDASTGLLTAVSSGTAEIVYTMPTGCYRSRQILVHPSVEPVTGVFSICAGNNATLANPVSGGTWTSNNLSVAPIGMLTGTYSGNVAGTAVVTYTLPTGCKTTQVLVVNPLPGNITGVSHVCEGAMSTLGNSISGGSWSSSDISIAGIGGTGVLSGVTPGIVSIVYELPTGCSRMRTVTVDPVPAVNTITGGGTYCEGGIGVSVGLDGSENGTIYRLINGGVLASVTGDGSAVDFGLQVSAGTYTVNATNAFGCNTIMSGGADVIVTPTVVPDVTILSAMGDRFCAGTMASFTVSTVNGGISPVFEWSVNGTVVGAASSYSYTPATGDVITAAMTSSEACPSVATVTDVVAPTVVPNLAPSVTIIVGPDDTVCEGSTAVFHATAVNGGTGPLFTWIVGGSIVSGVTDPVYAFVPTNGQSVVCKLNSNYECTSTNDVSSNPITMHVDKRFVPVLEVAVEPGTVIQQGQTAIFTATISEAGLAPGFQWLINNVIVEGANTATFSTNSLNDGDAVKCIVYGTAPCGLATMNVVDMKVIPATGVTQYAHTASNIVLVPNPNSGAFELRGSLGLSGETFVNIEVIDMLGRKVFEKSCAVQNDRIGEKVQLDNSLVNGVYILNLTNGTERKTFHFVLKQ